MPDSLRNVLCASFLCASKFSLRKLHVQDSLRKFLGNFCVSSQILCGGSLNKCSAQFICASFLRQDLHASFCKQIPKFLLFSLRNISLRKQVFCAQAFSAQVSLHLVSLSKCSEHFICVSFLLKICKQVAASRFPAQVSLRIFIFAFFSAQVLYASASCLSKIIYASLLVQVLHANLSAQVPKFLCASSLCEFLKNNFRRLIHERAK